MTVDIEKLEALAKGCRDEVIRSHGWTGMIADAGLLRRDSEFLKECSPQAVLDLIASGKRMASRLMYCPACQGEGEVYSGRNSYEGYNQPPEPIMNKCGECDGDGALGDTAECISILDELEMLRAELADLKTGYEAYERVNADWRAEVGRLKSENEKLRKSLCNVMAEVDGNIRETVRDCVNGLDDVQDIYGYCDSIEAIVDAALSMEQSHD